MQHPTRPHGPTPPECEDAFTQAGLLGWVQKPENGSGKIARQPIMALNAFLTYPSIQKDAHAQATPIAG